MHPRRRALVLLAINGALMLAISWRFVVLKGAWEGWMARQETWHMLHGEQSP